MGMKELAARYTSDWLLHQALVIGDCEDDEFTGILRWYRLSPVV